jgi:hypothetical protein
MYTFLIILVVLLPFPLYVLYKKTIGKTNDAKKAIELKTAFDQLTRKNKLSVDEVELFNNKVIGIDKKNNKFVWIEFAGSSLWKRCISLNDLESHKIRNIVDKMDDCIFGIVMELKFKTQKPVSFTFYDNATDNISAFPFLREKAKYWNARIYFHANAGERFFLLT